APSLWTRDRELVELNEPGRPRSRALGQVELREQRSKGAPVGASNTAQALVDLFESFRSMGYSDVDALHAVRGRDLTVGEAKQLLEAGGLELGDELTELRG